MGEPARMVRTATPTSSPGMAHPLPCRRVWAKLFRFRPSACRWACAAGADIGGNSAGNPGRRLSVRDRGGSGGLSCVLDLSGDHLRTVLWLLLLLRRPGWRWRWPLPRRGTWPRSTECSSISVLHLRAQASGGELGGRPCFPAARGHASLRPLEATPGGLPHLRHPVDVDRARIGGEGADRACARER